MTSVIKVDNIQNSSGTAALAIDSSGRVTMANTVQIDNWRLTANFTTNAATVTGWEQPDDATSATAGASMSESSGIFTFPNTGLWKVTGCIMTSLVNADTSGGVFYHVSSDSGSNYDIIAGSFEARDATQVSYNQMLINVTDASTFRFKLVSHSISSGGNITGNTDLNYTNLMFERITDSQ